MALHLYHQVTFILICAGLNGVFVPTTPTSYGLTWWTDANGLPAGRRLYREECGALQDLWRRQHLCKAYFKTQHWIKPSYLHKM